MTEKHKLRVQFSDRIRECPACGEHEGQGVLGYPSQSPRWAALSIFVCSACGFGYVPALDFDLADYYSAEYGRGHQKRHKLPHPGDFFKSIDQSSRPFVTRARKHNKILTQFGSDFHIVLEHGPGPGAFLHYCPAKRKLAVELDQLSFPYLDHIGVQRISPEAASELDGQLDLVAASHFLEHLPWDQADQFLASCAQLLRPNGLLLLEVPEWGHLYGRSLPKRQGHEPHTLFFSPQSLLRYVQRTNLTVLYLQTRKRIFDVDDAGRVSLTSFRDNTDPQGSQLCCVLRKPQQ